MVKYKEKGKLFSESYSTRAANTTLPGQSGHKPVEHEASSRLFYLVIELLIAFRKKIPETEASSVVCHCLTRMILLLKNNCCTAWSLHSQVKIFIIKVCGIEIAFIVSTAFPLLVATLNRGHSLY